ncbi:S-adenosyl-L-methionine-dependent methyltransferase [Trichoderma sp. TUCIM 5745]
MGVPPNSLRKHGERNALPEFRDFQFTFDFHDAIEPDQFAMRMIDDDESLSSSVLDYPEEFGRTYHAYHAGSYVYPNDLTEQERLALQGPIIKRLFDDRLYFAPLSRSDPPSEPWSYSDKFGYIHTRLTAGCWSSFEEQVAQQAFDALEPGGWFEAQETEAFFCCDDGTMDPNGPMCTWFQEMRDACDKLDRPATLGASLKEIFERVGFVDVEQLVFRLPLNAWPRDERLKDLGWMWGQNFSQGLNGFSTLLMNRAYGRTQDEIELSLVRVREEILDPRVHAYMPIFVVYGRKPFIGEMVE